MIKSGDTGDHFYTFRIPEDIAKDHKNKNLNKYPEGESFKEKYVHDE